MSDAAVTLSCVMTPAPSAGRRKRLSEDDVAALRTAVADGKKPRVTLHGNQFGDGVRGQVLAVGDPATDGPEFITVRAKLAGTMETLQFGPDELHTGSALARGSSPRSSGAQRSTPKVRNPRPSPGGDPEPGRQPIAPPAPATTGTNGDAATDERAGGGQESRRPRASRRPGPQPGATTTQPSRTTRRKQPAVTITITSSGEQWTLSAARGGRSLQKPTPVSPGAVLGAARLFDVPALQQAVGEVVAAAKAEATERAGRLRQELAEVQSLLDSLDAPSPRRR